MRIHLEHTRPPLEEALRDSSVLHQLESALPGVLRQQRWFGARTATDIEAHIAAVAPVPGAESMAIVAVDVTAGGETVRYQLPLHIDTHDDSGVVLVDALQSPAGAAALREVMLGDAPAAEAVPRLRAERFDDAVCDGDPRPLGVEQSNSSVVFGDACILKVFRTLPPGNNPDVELTAWLSGPGGFSGVAPVHARLEWDFGDHQSDAAVLQAFVRNRGDGWSWALSRAQEAFAACATPAEVPAYLAREPATVEGAAGLGAVTARLHTTLATATGPAMAPRDATAADWHAWQSETRAEAARTADLLDPRDPGLAGRIREYSASPTSQALSAGIGQLTRVHGDYHLGQVLDAPGGWVILDFEGEPARPLHERVVLNHPLVDVAGMLRSWSYAAHTAGRDHSAREAWLGAVTQAFLDAYWRQAAAGSASFLPGPNVRQDLLQLFTLRKALYEVRYELGSRPDWVSIPASAVAAMLERP